MQVSDTLVISQLADVLYDFLPGKAHPFANQDISFEGVSYKLGISKFWQGGSKKPAITELLSKVFEYERSKFCNLILETINTSLRYKPKELYVEKIININNLLLRLCFEIPELNDRTFLASLPSNTKNTTQNTLSKDMRKQLFENFMKLSHPSNTPQSRGFSFEKFLNSMFLSSGLNPRESFRLVGEQIDGSIELDHEIYLIEAKWQNNKISVSDLDAFSSKIKRKTNWTRGLFISISGFSIEAIQAFEKGEVNLITMDGEDLYYILDGCNDKYIDLDSCIRAKMRMAAETGNISHPVRYIIE